MGGRVLTSEADISSSRRPEVLLQVGCDKESWCVEGKRRLFYTWRAEQILEDTVPSRIELTRLEQYQLGVELFIRRTQPLLCEDNSYFTSQWLLGPLRDVRRQ